MIADHYYDSLLHLVFRYGLQKTKDQGLQVTDKTFACNVHEGYYLAQDQIIEALTKNQAERRTIPKRDKGQLAANQYSDAVIRSFANSMAWTMLGGEKHIVRRLNDGKPPVPILSTNLSDTLAFISECKKDLQSFYLITDTTSSIKHGDLLSIHLDDNPRIELLELKSGKVNQQILTELAKTKQTTSAPPKSNGLDDPRLIDQARRIQQQEDRIHKTLRNINAGNGPDAITGDSYRLIDQRVFLEEYTPQLLDLIHNVHTKGWAIDLVDDCLYLGCYTNHRFGMGALQGWLQSMGVDTRITDLRTSVFAPGTMPILMNPELRPHVKDIVTGKISILMALDQRKLVQLMIERGLDARLLTEKQSMNLKKRIEPAYRQHRLQGRSIQISGNTGMEVTLTDGFYERIFYDLVRPSECARLEYFVVNEAEQNGPAF